MPAKPTQRASPSLISATKRLLAAALVDDAANEFFALLSQSCVPIRSFNFVYRSLLSDPRKRSFIEILSGEPQLPDRYLLSILLTTKYTVIVILDLLFCNVRSAEFGMIGLVILGVTL